MIVDWWPWLLVALVVLGVLGSMARVPLRRRRGLALAEHIGADPEDAPLPAVVANPLHADAETRARVTAVCTAHGWAEPLWLETTPEDPGSGQATEAVEQGADVVIACGGDGTVRAVAEVLAGTGVAMGLLPIGTGNLLARTLGGPTEVIAATRAALTGDDRAIDVGRIRVDDTEDERVFLVMAGTGLDAAIMANTRDSLKARIGTFAYVLAGLRAMWATSTGLTISVDDGPALRRHSRTVLVGNSGTLAGGLVLMPAAVIDDGQLDVVNIAPNSFAGWVAVLLRVLTRKRKGHRRVEHWQAKTVVITTEHPQAAQIDGDPIGEVSQLTIRVDPAALLVRVPRAPEPRALEAGRPT